MDNILLKRLERDSRVRRFGAAVRTAGPTRPPRRDRNELRPGPAADHSKIQIGADDLDEIPQHAVTQGECGQRMPATPKGT